MSLWALAAKSTFSLDLESANSSLGSARALACYASPARTFGASPKSFLYSTKESHWRGANDSARRVRSPEKTRVIARTSFGESGHVQTHRKFWPRLRRVMKWEFTPAQYFRGRSATPSPSKSIRRGIPQSVGQIFHQAIFHPRRRFCRPDQNLRH